MEKKEPRYPIKAIINASKIMDYFIKRGKPVTISELNNKINLYTSTIHRILDTLNYINYVDKNSDNVTYQLGIKSLELGMAKLSQLDIVKEAMPYIKQLSETINENVYLGVLYEGTVFYEAKMECSKPVKVVTHVGARAPFNCTALGKVLISFLPKNERERIYKKVGLIKSTKNSIIDKESFEKEVKKVKTRGYALDNEEYEIDVSCIAAPVYNHRGQVIAALSISGPSYRFKTKIKTQARAQVIRYAKMLSSCLGYYNQSE